MMEVCGLGDIVDWVIEDVIGECCDTVRRQRRQW